MAETIKRESSTNSKLVGDLDNFRSKYLEHDFEENLSVVFPSGEIYSFENQKFILLLNSDIIDFKPSWKMRPDYVSFEYYNSVIYWPVILFINNINSIEDFKDLDYIYIPRFSAILNVISNRVPVKEVTPLDIEVVDESVKYLKRSPLDDMQVKNISSQINIDNFNNDYKRNDTNNQATVTLIETTETFTLTTENISNGYVILLNNPVNLSSISLYIDDYNVPQRYSYDYILKWDKYISWSASDVIGTGIYNIVDAGTKLTIVYVYQSGV